LQCSEILAQQAQYQQQQQQQQQQHQSQNNSQINQSHSSSMGSGSFHSTSGGSASTANGVGNHIVASFIDDLKQAQKHKQALRQQQSNASGGGGSTKISKSSFSSSSNKNNDKNSGGGDHHHQQQQQKGDIDLDMMSSNVLSNPMTVISAANKSSTAVSASAATSSSNTNNRNNSNQVNNIGAMSNLDKTGANGGRQMGLDDFDLIRVIGRGSYAKVFLVEYKRTRKCYAMKVIKKSTVNDDEDIDWVQTEKHVFEQATNHPFLVGLHSCFQSRVCSSSSSICAAAISCITCSASGVCLKITLASIRPKYLWHWTFCIRKASSIEI
jgi:hypothetical protein